MGMRIQGMVGMQTQGGSNHAIEPILEITLQGKVDTIVATYTLVNQSTILEELAMIQDRIGSTILYRHIEQPLPIGLNLQHGVVA